MSCQFVNESGHRFRFIGLDEEPLTELAPIQGYENEPIVSLEKAVHLLNQLVPEVEKMVWIVKQNHFGENHGLTIDESASIMLYTMEWLPREKSFYAILNNTLRAANRHLLRPWFLYLRLIMTSLSKIPSDFHYLNVYGGSKSDLSAQYPRGRSFIWWGFTSCTESLEVLADERFLGTTGIRTLFTIQCHSAKRVKQHSFYPDEEEFLLPPARQFQVVDSVNAGNGLHIIQLKEMQPMYPLINPVPQPLTLTSQSAKQSLSSSRPANQIPTLRKPLKGDNLKLQDRADDLYSDPVIVSVKTTSSLGHRSSSPEIFIDQISLRFKPLHHTFKDFANRSHCHFEIVDFCSENCI